MDKRMLVVFGLLILVTVFAKHDGKKKCDLVNGCVYDRRCYKKNASFTPKGQCLLVTCSGNNETSLLPCGLVGVPQGCSYTLETVGPPYPECCSKVKCP